MNSDCDILTSLLDFYKKNRDAILEYKDYATVFPTDYIERIQEKMSLNRRLQDCTVLILTANAVEQNILTHKLYKETNSNRDERRLCEIQADECIYQFGTVDKIKIVHMHPQSTSSFVIGGSADAVRSAIERFRPKLVVSLGVAFGIDCNTQELGDVLVSSGIIPYDVFNKDTNGKIKLRPKDKEYTHEALNAWDVLLRNQKFSLEKNSERKSLTNKRLEFKWQYETMLSGGCVLNNDKKKKALLKAAKDIGEKSIIGGEMEGIGVYHECKKPNIPCIIIKGICDWAAQKNAWDNVIKAVEKERTETDICKDGITNDLVKDCVQAYAMDHATEALFRLLRFDTACFDLNATELSPKNLIKHKDIIIGTIFHFLKLHKSILWGIVRIIAVLFVSRIIYTLKAI